MNQQHLPKPIENWLHKNLIRIEMTGLAIIILGFLINSPTFVAIALTTIAIAYFLNAFRRGEGINMFLNRFFGVFWSVGTLGIMFTILNLEGANVMVKVSFYALAVISILFIIIKLRNKKIIFESSIVRSFTLIAINAYILFGSSNYLVEHFTVL